MSGTAPRGYPERVPDPKPETEPEVAPPTEPKPKRQPYRGQRQDRFKLILAPVMALFGMGFPVGVVASEVGWSHTGTVLASSVPVGLLGVLIGTALFCGLRINVAGWLMVIALIGGNGLWVHAHLGFGVPAWYMGLLGGSILGVHARWAIERRRRGNEG